jgi:hypothetical protein
MIVCARIRVNDWQAANFAGNAFDEGTIAPIRFNAPASIVEHSLKKEKEGTGNCSLSAWQRKTGPVVIVSRSDPDPPCVLAIYVKSASVMLVLML